ncbi:MAG: hypothetical protein ACFFG0_02225 [Candidatus Thorarchaeota archaeon]
MRSAIFLGCLCIALSIQDLAGLTIDKETNNIFMTLIFIFALCDAFYIVIDFLKIRR